jgi:RHS repeat-associated protein
MNIRQLTKIAFAISFAFLLHSQQAQATTPTYDQCVYALDPTAANALNINGAVIINAPSCGVVVDSSSSKAFLFSGAGSFTAKYFDLVGGYSTSGAVTLSPKPTTSAASQADPLTFLVPPVGSSCTYTNFKVSTGSSTLNPGTYCNGITISGATTVTFNPGTYILMGGGLNVTGSSILKGSGVTFYLTKGLGYNYGPLAISGAVVATLSAPTSGSYKSILFYQDRSIGTGQAANTFTGSSASSLSGALYFPTTALTFAGAGSGGNCLILVADTISMTGAAALGNSCSGGSPLQPPVSVSVTPTTATLYGGQTQQFNATVANSTNTAVTWTISPATGAGTISTAGLYTAPATISAQQTVTITATSQASTTAIASATATLIPKTTPTITWATPAAIIYGTALSATQLDATTNVAGSFAYTPAVGTVLAVGSQTLSVVFTPTVTAEYNTATASVSQIVAKATPTVTVWPTASAITYGQTLASSTLSGGTASVAGSFAFTTPTTAPGVGTASQSVIFTPAVPADYNSVTGAVPVTVGLEAQTISFPAIAAQTVGTPLTLAATASSSLAVSFTSATQSICTVTGTTATFVATGTCTIDANQPGNSVYAAATQVAQSFSVGGEAQTISFPAIAAQTVGTPLTLAATASSSLAVSFTSATQSICTVTGTTATFVTTGTCTIDANQAGNSVYAAATQVAQSFSVNQTVSVSVTPLTATLYGGQTQQFTASVANSSNQTVFWMLTPAGVGTISQTGVYTAPTTISAQQTVTITATSQADTTKSASATITLALSQCTSSGYSYQRAIIIDHSKIPNTDQSNFPFLFNTTDPLLATTANGGHVINPNGYDIVFTSDPAGQNKLDYEMEEYDPVHGQVIAWVRIPTLSHTTDTIIYLFYGNSSITTLQQNPTGVWDSNYQAVYHLANVSGTTAADSTVNGNNGTLTNISTASGEIDGAAGFNGASSYIQIPSADFASYPTSGSTTTGFSASFGAWFKTASPGVILSQTDGTEPSGGPGGWVPALYIDNTGILRASIFWHAGQSNQIATATTYNDNKWHFAVDTYANGTESLYVDGQNVGSQQVTEYSYNSTYAYFVGTGETNSWPRTNGGWLYFNGVLDEVNVSNIARSADWIATEYSNQSSPSTFYTLYQENAVEVVPATASLYAGQSQQFAVTGICGSAMTWSMPSGAQGTLTANGLYTAPANITTLQMVTVTASSQASGTVIGSAIVTLLPPPTLTLAAASQPPYATGSSQGFVVTLKDATGAPESNVTVTFTVAGENSNTGSTTTDSNGIASFAYIGANAGNDTIQATAIVNGQQLTSNSVSVSWTSPVPANAEGSVTLQAGPNLGLGGLLGAFTDGDGTVIEPIAIGAAPKNFVVPAGATQLQLGVDDDGFWNNLGTGFVIEVNGGLVTVPPTAMPWTWVVRGLNTNYQFGYDDGTNPVVALTGLTQGEVVSVVYQSGNVSVGPCCAAFNANGNPERITGTTIGLGDYYATLYMTASSYPVGQPVAFTAVVTNGSGTPLANVPVMLNITGANAQELEATTDSTGIAAFTYIGINAGTDIVKARAFLTGETSLVSGQTTVTWIGFTSLPPLGSLTLTPSTVQPLPVGGQQAFTVFATDASGSPVSNASVGLQITGVDDFSLSGTTDATGYATILYRDMNPGTAFVQATASIDDVVTYSNIVSVSWTLPGTASGGSGTISIGLTADSTVVLPSTLQLTGTVTDSNGLTPTIAWSQVTCSSCGPGTVTFSNSQQTINNGVITVVTTASFSQPGNYELQLSASDTMGNSGSVPFSVTVNPVADTPQGWIGSPLNGTAVSGIVPITLASGVTIQSGAVLTYYPTNNPGNSTTLPITAESGTIATLDTTMLANGSYWIQLQATDTSGSLEYSLVMVTVTGNYKPGRVTATVTDLVVPATGLAINIQRTYDSLNAATSSDFGYGWNLGTNVNLTVDNAGNVTFTLNGQRKTFYLTPRNPSCAIGICLPFWYSAFTPEPGLFGTLTDAGTGCGISIGNGLSIGFDLLIPDGSMWDCLSGGQYTATEYIYTDISGTAYTISAGGQLQSIQDRSGNGLTITANGITSTTGLNVPFVRDAQKRITQITDPKGNIYSYGYDANGNLATVTYPNTTTPSTYIYNANHFYLSGTDTRGNPLPVTTYYTATNADPNGLPLSGRLQSVTDAFNNTTSYAYNLSTNTTTVTYPDSGTATMVYDSYGDLLSSTDPLGNTTTNTYDVGYDLHCNVSDLYGQPAQNHLLTSTTDPLGHTSCYINDGSTGLRIASTYPATPTSHNTTSATNYNQYGEPIQTLDELDNSRFFNYDANYNPQSVTDSIGTLASFIFNANTTLQAGAIGFDISVNPAQASQFTYDANGNMASRTDALGRTTSYTYNSLGQKTAMVTPTPANPTGGSASTTIYTYDALGNLTQTAAPLNRITGSAYDANGNKLSNTDARGNVTNYVYDALNRLIETDYPDQTKSTKSYDFRNNVLQATDQAGNITLNTYDLAGRLTSVTRGSGTSNASITSYEYDNANRKVSETDALNHTTTYTYDADNRLIAISGVKGNLSYAYDDAGNRISQTDGRGNTTQFQYDARKRLVKTINPDNTTIVNTYDGPGNLASVTDQAGNAVQYTYDPANQLKTVVQVNHPNPSNNTNLFSYDSLGNLTGLTDENLHTTQNAFDLFNEPTSKLLPDQTHTETRQYDAAGNLVSLTHFNGVTTTYTYDALNRLITRATPGEATVSFTYTPTGKYLTSTAGDGTVNYGYDSLDRLTTKATPQGTLSYTFDAAGHVETITSSNPNGVSVGYSYDDLNRLSTVVDNRLSGNNTTTYNYDNASNVATVAYSNGLQSSFTYDTLNRLTAMNAGTATYSYQLGATGNRTSATEGNGRTLSWNYDGIYRLTSETISGDPYQNNGSVAYGLDPVGNRLSENSTLPGINSGSFGYNADDEISSESYDANGNVIATGNMSYTYDSENHMLTANGNGKSISMVYDAFGNRVSKTVNGVTTQYLVEDDVNPTGLPQVVEELTGSFGAGVVTRTYTYGLQRISENLSPAVSGNSTWTTSFYVYDGGGSVRQLTNSNGVVTDEYEYDAYGNSFTKSGTTPNNYLYRAEQYDSDLGLYYLRARYYNPATGRFLSRDPDEGKYWEPATLHKYLYANGDPVNGIDPSGRGAIAEYSFNIGNTTYKIALHAAHHYWVLPIIKALWCIHLALYSIEQGVGLNWSLQIPLPWCSTGGPF